jgi:hypothetical protein
LRRPPDRAGELSATISEAAITVPGAFHARALFDRSIVGRPLLDGRRIIRWDG